MMAVLSCALLLVVPVAAKLPTFAVRVVDADTQTGIPLIWLETVSHVRVVTDSNGIAVFSQPELFGSARLIYVFAYGPGYEHPTDGFGIFVHALCLFNNDFSMICFI